MTKASEQICSNSARIAPHIDIFGTTNEAMSRHSPLLAKLERKADFLTKKGPTSFEVGPFEFKSGSVLLFHTATV